MCERLETGPVQMPDDWPGIFIRGDNAMNYGFQLILAAEALEGNLDEGLLSDQLRNLSRLLMSCHNGCEVTCIERTTKEARK